MANPQKIRAKVNNIDSFGKQVFKIDFITEKKFPRYKAGQFLHLTLEDFDPTTGFWPESRVFSIASVSDDRKKVSIVYSVKGVYTKKMEKQLIQGREVWLKAPYGEFIIPNHVNENETAVLIAGGTGVSPFIPFLLQKKSSININLNYGLRHRSLMIFDEALEIASLSEDFKLNLFLEDSSGFMNKNIKAKEYDGILSISSILGEIDNINDSVFFLSGPPQMIESFKSQLIESGIYSEKIIIDEWG